MPEQQIWVEGFSKPGINATAVLLDTIEDESFQGACIKLMKRDEMFGKYFDRRTRKFMGCKVFETEVKARRKWG